MVNSNVNYQNNENVIDCFAYKNPHLPWRNIDFNDIGFTLFIEYYIKTKKFMNTKFSSNISFGQNIDI